MIAVLLNQLSSKCDIKLLTKKLLISFRELKVLGITDLQEEPSRSSVHSSHSEVSQPEKLSYPNIELLAKTLVSIKQSASPQKSQKLSEMIHELSKLSEPSELDKSDLN